MAKAEDQWVQDGRRIKVWFVMRRDLPMSQPKFGVQIGHGTDMVHLAARLYAVSYYENWIDPEVGNRRKIVLGAKSLTEIEKIKADVEAAGMAAEWIWDAGLTEFGQETCTGLVIFPWDDTMVPKSLKRAQAWKPMADPDA